MTTGWRLEDPPLTCRMRNRKNGSLEAAAFPLPVKLDAVRREVRFEVMGRGPILVLDMAPETGIAGRLLTILESELVVVIASGDRQLDDRLTRIQPQAVVAVGCSSRMAQVKSVVIAIHQSGPLTPVIVALDLANSRSVFELLEWGASDFITLSCAPSEILAAGPRDAPLATSSPAPQPPFHHALERLLLHTRISMEQVLVHLASGIGNIVLATPVLIALEEMGFTTDVRLDADYPATADLLSGWSVIRQVFTASAQPDTRRYRHILPAIPPFYWNSFSHQYRGVSGVIPRPPDSLFYQDEQNYYMAFARALGYAARTAPLPRLPIAPDARWGVTAGTVALAPGCKTGEMTAKRWPYFADLARGLSDVAVIGTPDDISVNDFPSHARSFVGQLTLRGTAELIAAAGAVVANDSGLAHVAAAVGTPTVILFGPTPSLTLGRFPPHVSILSLAMQCQPCWHTAPLRACGRRVDCLRRLPAERVFEELISIGQIERT